MTKITEEQAKEFLEEINENDKIAIICHTDLDGFASGILFYDFCLKQNCKSIQIYPINYGESKNLDKKLIKNTKILIADLGPGAVSELLKKLPKEIEIFYTDHHPEEEEEKFSIPKKVLELRTTNQGYIPSSRTVYELCGGKYWLAVLGTLSDFGEKEEANKEFLEKFIQESGKSLEYLKKEAMYKVSRTITYFEKHTDRDFFNILKNLEFLEDIKQLEEYDKPVKEEFERFVERFETNSEKMNKIIFYYFSPNYNIKSFLITFLSIKYPEKIFIFATPIGDELIKISARNQSGEYNVSKILKDCLQNIPESLAGGHKSAGGGQLKKARLEEFKKNLKYYNLSKAIIKNEK